MYRVLVVPALLGSAVASAGTKFDDGYGKDPTVPLSYPFENVAPTPTHDRSYDMTFGIRLRSVSVPKSILDVWFYDADDPDWAYIESRPKLRGTALGLEYGLRGKTGNGLFYAEFIDAGLTDGYWDDVEPDANHLDGDYLAPSSALGLIAFGADYAYEAHIVRIEQTGGRIGVSFLAGGGLGLGVLAGRLDRWGPDSQGNPSYKRFLDGLPPDDGKKVPRVYPMVDLNAGMRFSFGDRVALRLEGGLHTLLYYGTSLAVVF
ncbi:MAG: hypothetical protein ABMB14_30280 [Myxococcota bacterium]